MRVKELPEDFVVEELPDIQEGSSLLVRMEKRGMTTEDAVAAICAALNLPRKSVQYAGAKDARAHTTQLLSVDPRAADAIRSFRHERITLALEGRGARLSLGSLRGNRFTITVRDLGDERCTPRERMPNYYDEQRFSVANAEIGLHLVKDELDKATARIVETDAQVGPRIVAHLAERRNDHVGALLLVPRHTLLMYVHAYQSKLFNALLAAHIRKHDPAARILDGPVPIVVGDAPDADIPLVGFDDLPDAWRGRAEALLDADGVAQRDFVNRKLPFLTVEGTTRHAFVPLVDLEISSKTPDELHAGREKQTVSFTLGRGAYATIAIRCLFS